jgi:HAMP domain-containing protein
VSVSDLASLFTGIAAIITALSGAFVTTWALLRGSPRERAGAARAAVRQLLEPPGDEDDELADAIEELVQELRRKRGEDR